MLPASGLGTDRPGRPRAIARGKHHGGHVEANRSEDNDAAPPLALEAEIHDEGFGWRRSSAHSLAAISRLPEHSGCHRKWVWKMDHTELSEVLSVIQCRASLHDDTNQAQMYL